jgi:hypothetical protein
MKEIVERQAQKANPKLTEPKQPWVKPTEDTGFRDTVAA